MPNINKNIIMQAGAAVANATNKAAGLSASTPEPGTIISAIQLVNGGRTIGPAALAHFTESVRNKLLSLLVTMEPIQDFNGYGHPWPAGGGKNKLPNDAGTTTLNGVSFIKQSDGSVLVNGTASADISYDYYRNLTKLPTGIEAGGSYILSNNIAPTPCSIEAYCSTNGTSFQYATGLNMATSLNFTVPTGAVGFLMRIKISQGDTASNMTFKPMIRLATETDATFVPYSNICPISGRTGLDVYAGPTSAIGDATTYSMDWTTPAGTVYAGSADIVTGDIKAAPEYASYNGETLVGPWISSMDAYDPEGTPTTGAQVVDLGGTMTEYHITGQDIVTLVGDNYIWSDSGDVTITE